MISSLLRFSNDLGNKSSSSFFFFFFFFFFFMVSYNSLTIIPMETLLLHLFIFHIFFSFSFVRCQFSREAPCNSCQNRFVDQQFSKERVCNDYATDIALDCGLRDKIRIDPDGRRWIGDVNSDIQPSEQMNGSNTSTIATAPHNTGDIVYNTVRLSRSPFTYFLPVNESSSIFIRLYFLPETYGNFTKSNASFTVKTGPFTLLNFTAAATDDNNQSVYNYREFCIHVDPMARKIVNITFIPSPNSYAFINGIEVVSMKSDLYYTPESGIGNDTAMELYYRGNIGGEDIPQHQDDYCMYRKWIKDYNDIGMEINNFRFTVSSSSDSWSKAPDKVYQSAVSVYGGGSSNFTWGYHVDGGFKYFVRLFFCQFQKQNQMHFNVYLNHEFKGKVDLVSLYYPLHKDYSVFVHESVTRLNITIEPNRSFSYVILNGIEVFKMSNNDGNLAVSLAKLVTVLTPSTKQQGNTMPSTNKPGNTKKAIIVGVCGGLGLAIIITLVGFLVMIKNKKKKEIEWSFLQEQGCRKFSFKQLLEATDYFNKKREVGAGGFGAVYKGIFKNMKGEDLTVAVKRLKPESVQGEKEFKTEIELLSKLRHCNIVSLIGYCFRDKDMLIVYEFMEKGTFKDHLYDTKNPPLPWTTRLQICHEAARGLNYLHTGQDQTIIHRDVKTANILLDQNFVAKVSDLGISKMGPKNSAAISTEVKGTGGYLDPEYYNSFQVTEKSDVYSFGVVLFEVLCGRKPLDLTLGEERFKLTRWAQKSMENGTVLQIIDQNLKGKISPECLKLYLKLAVSCVNSHMNDRPTMVVVEDELRRMIELQKEADCEMMEKNQDGDGEFRYSDELLFSLIPSMAAVSLESKSYKCHMENVISQSGTDFTTSTIKSEDPSTSTVTSRSN